VDRIAVSVSCVGIAVLMLDKNNAIENILKAVITSVILYPHL